MGCASRPAQPPEADARPDNLSPREVEVLKLIALGHTNAEIAATLFLSVRTVESHRAHIQQKVGLTTRAELVGSSRAAIPLRARQVAIFLTRDLTDLSLPQIGRLYGGRDHSTVLNSLRRVEAGLDDDPDLAEKLRELRGAIHNPVGDER